MFWRKNKHDDVRPHIEEVVNNLRLELGDLWAVINKQGEELCKQAHTMAALSEAPAPKKECCGKCHKKKEAVVEEPPKPEHETIYSKVIKALEEDDQKAFMQTFDDMLNACPHSKAEVARRIGVNSCTIWYWAKGRAFPDVKKDVLLSWLRQNHMLNTGLDQT